jgi:hypothetical protein
MYCLTGLGDVEVVHVRRLPVHCLTLPNLVWVELSLLLTLENNMFFSDAHYLSAVTDMNYR